MSPGLRAMLTPEVKMKARAGRAARRIPLAQRFHEKYRIEESGCWVWTAATDPRGYGKIGHEGRTLIATHVALELAGVQRPVGLCALHSCDNPPCVNPDHLRWGTRQENTADAWSRGSLNREIMVAAARKRWGLR